VKIGFLLTARLKSSRLKLKLTLPLNGYTVLERVIQRAKQVIECDDIVLCTSCSNQDLPLVRLAQKNGVYYFTGDSDDVLQRLTNAANLFNFDYVIGMTADNPLFSIYHANVLSDMIRQDPSLDFVYTEGLPVGVNVYAVSTNALRTVCQIKEQVDTEIWGYLVNRPEIFNVKSVPVDEFYAMPGCERITLDEAEDYDFIRSVYQAFGEDEVIDILDVKALLEQQPDLLSLHKNVKQRDLDSDVKEAIDNYYRNNRDQILKVKATVYG